MSSEVFVYGTLKTGQVRAHQWPLEPLQIRAAWTFGRLYDTGPFPALLDGDDRVTGQLWSFEEEDLPITFQVLDEIEGTNQPGEPNEYDRLVRQVFVQGQDQPVLATLYRFARSELVPTFEYLKPALEYAGQRYSIWPRDGSWLPESSSKES